MVVFSGHIRMAENRNVTVSSTFWCHVTKVFYLSLAFYNILCSTELNKTVIGQLMRTVVQQECLAAKGTTWLLKL